MHGKDRAFELNNKKPAEILRLDKSDEGIQIKGPADPDDRGLDVYNEIQTIIDIFDKLKKNHKN